MTPNQQSRMIKCLASLVAAMTLGALVLSVGEPARPRFDEAGARLASLDLIHHVSTDPNVAADKWRRIVVHRRVGPPDEPGLRLAALVRESGYHFVVTPAGRLLAGSAWRAQVPAGTPRDAVRICLSLADGDGRVRQVQRTVLEKLVQALSERCGIPQEAVQLPESINTELP